MKEKKLTIEQAWTLCLKMWKWIAENYKNDKIESTTQLKKRWLKENKTLPEMKDVDINYLSFSCFFCQYNVEQRASKIKVNYDDANMDCSKCPAKLVSKRFCCERYEAYNWMCKPKQFYKRIKELHEKFLKIQISAEKGKNDGCK